MPDPLFPNPDNVVGDDASWLLSQRKAAQFVAVQDQDANPDDAGRAQELSRATGDNPALIYGDLENYQKQHKAALTSALLDQNQYLRDYVTSHPLAGKVSNDDWGTLDAVSEKLYKFSVKSILDKAFEGFKEGYGDQPYGSWLPISDPGMNRLAWSELTALGYPIEATQRVFGGLIEGARRGATQFQVTLGADEGKAEQRSNELAAMLEAEFGGMTGRHPVGEPAVGAVKKASETLRSAKPYLDAGEGVPVGVHPVWDQVHAEQAKIDAKSLDELYREAQGSTTRERAPELFENFINQHTDAKIGIKSEEVAKLYGGKELGPEDNLLGFIPDLKQQLEFAQASGGDIEVPLASWLSRAEPEVAKELHDFIRVRPGGMTLDEAKELKPPEGGVASISALEPHDGVRASASLAPMEATGVRSVIPEAAQTTTVAHDAGETPALVFTGKEALSNVDLDNLTGVPRALHEFFGNRLETMAGDTPVYVLPTDEFQKVAEQQGLSGAHTLGMYHSDLHAIFLPEDVATGALGHSNAIHVLYHELAHAATFREMEEFPQLKNAIRRLMDEVRGPKPSEAYLSKYDYGFKNEGEFIAEAFSNPKFQELLSNTPISKELAQKLRMGKEKTLWDAIRTIIKDLITKLTGTRPPDTIMDGILRLGPTFEEAQRRRQLKVEDPAKYMTGQSAGMEAQGDLLGLTLEKTESHIDKAFDTFTHKYRVTEGGDEVGSLELTESKTGNLLYIDAVHIKGTNAIGPVAVRRLLDQLRQEFPNAERIAGHRVSGAKSGPDKGIPYAYVDLRSKDGGVAAMEQQLGLPSLTRLEDRELFAKANAIGMTVAQYKRYQELIAKRSAEDAEYMRKRGEREEAKRQSREWKDNEASVKAEVADDVKSRPDIAADRFLREGHLYGDKVKRVRLDQSKLSDEQKASLSPEHYGPGGVHPDDAAGLFGYQSGNALVSHLGRLEAERQTEGLTPQAHLNRIVNVETEREMKKRYGNLEENVLEAAKDHVISNTQLDMLHEEMVALAAKGGGQISFEKDQLKAWVKQQFRETQLGSISTDKFLASAGRAGREAELGLLEERPTDAFKAKQSQFISMLLANEAKKLDKERAGFDRFAKRFSRREVSGVPAEYTNWIHDILLRTGNPVRRSVQDLQDALGREKQKTLEDFVREKNASMFPNDPNFPAEGFNMPVAEFLFDPNWGRWEQPKKIEQMSVDEFRAVHDSLKTIAKNGQDENKLTVRGEKRDLAETIEKMVQQLKDTFGEAKQYPFGHKDKGIGHYLRTGIASLLQVESIFNRIDRGNPKGIFTSVITRSNFQGAYELNQAEKYYARKLRELSDFGDLKAKVDNPLIRDPLYDWELRGMTRENLLAVLQNAGNPSNLDKLARGYSSKERGIKVEPQDILHWLYANTTKEDWDRAQAIGDVFKEAFEESAQMYHSLSGVAPQKVELQPIQTPFGTYEGWYHPLIYDSSRPKSAKLMGPQPIEDGAYYRVATPSGYTKQRTGYAAPILLTMDSWPYRLQQILNDTKMRPTVSDTAKIFYNADFKMAMQKYYGKEIGDLLIPYLKDIAGQRQYKDAAHNAAVRFLEGARQNTIATLIGLNPGTVMKHGPTAAMNSIREVGLADYLKETLTLLSRDDDTGEKNWTFAFDNSQELPRRQRNWQETISGTTLDMFKENTLRNMAIKFGATPVAVSDLLSAVPTWLAAYKQAIRVGEDHGEAVFLADRAVRRAHGSSATVSRPRVMRGGPVANFVTPFYTFFNDMLQRQYETAWRMKDAMVGQDGGIGPALKELPHAMGGLWAYVLFPALIEQAVSPLVTDKDSWGTWAAKVMARDISSSIPVVRDVVEAWLGGRDPQIGLYSTGVQNLINEAKDIKIGPKSVSRQHMGKTIKHTAAAVGILTGLTNAQEGRTGQFIYDYATGQSHPRNFSEVWRGLRFGTTKEFKR